MDMLSFPQADGNNPSSSEIPASRLRRTGLAGMMVGVSNIATNFFRHLCLPLAGAHSISCDHFRRLQVRFHLLSFPWIPACAGMTTIFHQVYSFRRAYIFVPNLSKFLLPSFPRTDAAGMMSCQSRHGSLSFQFHYCQRCSVDFSLSFSQAVGGDPLGSALFA